MKITNKMSCSVYFPYIYKNNGRELKPGQTTEVSPMQYTNPLLIRDLTQGRISVELNDKDREIIGNAHIDKITKLANKNWPKEPKVIEKVIEKVVNKPAQVNTDSVKVEKIVPEIPPLAKSVKPIKAATNPSNPPPAKPIKPEEMGQVDLNSLNKVEGAKSSIDAINGFMGGLVK